MPNYKNIFVDKRKLPYINNNTLAASGFFSRQRNQGPHFLNALPVDVLRMIFDKLSVKELKALAETSSEMLKEMMKPSSKAINGFRYPVDSYPYLQEIFISGFVSSLQKKGVYDAFLSKFLKHSDEERGVSDGQAIEQALTRIIQLDNSTLKAGINFYKRENLIGYLSLYNQLDHNGHVVLDNNGLEIFDRQIGKPPFVILIASSILLMAGLFTPTTLMGITLLWVGLPLLIAPVLIFITFIVIRSLLRKTNPFEVLENIQDEEADTSELDADLALGISTEEESEAEADDDDDLLSVRREAPARLDLSGDNDYHPSETSPLLRRY